MNQRQIRKIKKKKKRNGLRVFARNHKFRFISLQRATFAQLFFAERTARLIALQNELSKCSLSLLLLLLLLLLPPLSKRPFSRNVIKWTRIMLILQIPYSTYQRHSCSRRRETRNFKEGSIIKGKEKRKENLFANFQLSSTHPKDSLSFFLFFFSYRNAVEIFWIELTLRWLLNRCYQLALVFRIRFTTPSTASAHISTY